MSSDKEGKWTKKGHFWEDPNYEIKTPEQALNWLIELVDGVTMARTDCDVRFPDDTRKTAEHQKLSFQVFLSRQGSALGAAMTLHRTRLITDRTWDEMRQRLINLSGPTVVRVMS